MAFQKMQDFTFKHSEQQDAIYTEYTAQQIKALFDSRGDELRTALNLLINALNSTDGAGNIGTQSIQDLDGETIQEMLKNIRDRLKSKADGSSGADYINATAIEGLTGETVQSLLEALKTFVDSTKTALDNKIDTTKTSLEGSISTTLGGIKASTISADPIAVGSGNTVQAQLAWLLTQIAVAATGSIPDGSLSEVKLAQSLIDKINKALSNVGVLTTLLTNDKSSLVNALNEVLEILNAHSADVAHVFYADDTGTADAKVVTISPAPTDYLKGLGISFTNLAQNTGAVTLNVNGLGAKSILKSNGSALSSGSLKANSVYTVRYNGTAFILQGEGGSGNAVASDLLSGKTATTDAGEIVGTMPNRGVFNLSLGATVPAGYYSGGTVPSGKQIRSGAIYSSEHPNVGGMQAVQVSGLPFTPSVIYCYVNNDSTKSVCYIPSLDFRLGKNGSSPSMGNYFSISPGAFIVPVSFIGVSSPTIMNWVAIE